MKDKVGLAGQIKFGKVFLFQYTTLEANGAPLTITTAAFGVTNYGTHRYLTAVNSHLVELHYVGAAVGMRPRRYHDTETKVKVYVYLVLGLLSFFVLANVPPTSNGRSA